MDNDDYNSNNDGLQINMKITINYEKNDKIIKNATIMK